MAGHGQAREEEEGVVTSNLNTNLNMGCGSRRFYMYNEIPRFPP